MKYTYLKEIGREVSRLIMGTMYLYNGSEEDGFAFLDMAVSMGINILIPHRAMERVRSFLANGWKQDRTARML